MLSLIIYVWQLSSVNILLVFMSVSGLRNNNVLFITTETRDIIL